MGLKWISYKIIGYGLVGFMIQLSRLRDRDF